MGRRKKVVEEPVVEVQKQKEEKVTIKTKQTCLFKVTPLSDNVKLYKHPTDKKTQGKLKRGQVYNVMCEINYTFVKMYRLDTGHYIIADQNICIV
jgi:hypothetical protein